MRVLRISDIICTAHYSSLITHYSSLSRVAGGQDTLDTYIADAPGRVEGRTRVTRTWHTRQFQTNRLIFGFPGMPDLIIRGTPDDHQGFAQSCCGMRWTAVVADEHAALFNQDEQIVEPEIRPVAVRVPRMPADIQQNLGLEWSGGKDDRKAVALMKPVGKLGEFFLLPALCRQGCRRVNQQILRWLQACAGQPLRIRARSPPDPNAATLVAWPVSGAATIA